MKRCWQFILKLIFRFRIYFIWSRVYRYLYERKHDKFVIPTFRALHLLEDNIGKMKWRADNWRMLWDAISTPQAVWWRHLNNQAAGDCDDISIAAAASFAKSYPFVDTLGFQFTTPLMMSVVWMDGWKVTGHNICVIPYTCENKSYWAHWSNWHAGHIRWGFESLEAVARDIAPNVIFAGVWDLQLHYIDYKIF